MSIVATQINKSFGSYAALANVSLTVPSGKLVALLGPSGSGKTTLLRIIAGLEHADPGSGRILFHGEDVTDRPAGKRRVGFVFQHYALFRHMTVFENIAFGLKVRRWRDRPKRAEITDRVRKLLKLVQLDELGGRYPTQLSGGQRQRVALARALAVEPRVLLLDEPFGALDAKVRKELRRWLRQFHEEVHLTTVFVTHDQEEALEIADEVVIMNRAQIEQVGTPQEVYDRPASPFVYQFLGNVNQVRLPIRGVDSVRELTTSADGSVAYVRPHDIDLARFVAGVPGEPALVRSIHAAGPFARIRCTRGREDEIVEAELPRSRLCELRLSVGDAVLLRLRDSKASGEDFSI
ncbi:MAG: sulfate ABC transporter ATP-binding protein [Opitutaceae bacterium]|nr:sulfate ABC transporter ATP-binding protein [Opitutaceae bacterium]